MADRSIPVSILLWIGRVLDGLRRGLHLVFLLLVFFLGLGLLALFRPAAIVVPESAALVVAPRGVLVDQLSGDPLARALAQLRGATAAQTLLRDLVESIRFARDDDRIRLLVLDLNGLAESGLSKLEELADAIEFFSESGKPVVSTADSYTRDQYLIATTADDVFMNPMGVVLVEGYSTFRPYYKSLLDMVYVDYEVWTAGEYKSFAEPTTRDDMSEQDAESSLAYLGALWDAWQQAVTTARQIDPNAMQTYADNLPELLEGTRGDTARLALDYGLVDALLTRTEFRDRIAQLFETGVEEDGSYPSIDHNSYLASRRLGAALESHEDKVAVLVLSGTIYDGVEAPGAIGGDSAVQQIRQVTNDESIDALVLSVDSGGGSAFASELILQALLEYQDTGRPLVVSMSSVAASGGYWVSMSADEIWAHPTTLTGSIGVGSVVATVPRLLERIGVDVDGVGTTQLAGQFDPLQGFGDDARSLYAQQVEYLYELFVGKVAQWRERDYDVMEAVARGRVWIGTAALENGLVDRLGGIDEAIESAAALASLEPDSYETVYVEPELDFAGRMTINVARAAGPALQLLNRTPPWAHSLEGIIETIATPLEYLNRLNDPRGMYMLCQCGPH